MLIKLDKFYKECNYKETNIKISEVIAIKDIIRFKTLDELLDSKNGIIDEININLIEFETGDIEKICVEKRDDGIFINDTKQEISIKYL